MTSGRAHAPRPLRRGGACDEFARSPVDSVRPRAEAGLGVGSLRCNPSRNRGRRRTSRARRRRVRSPVIGAGKRAVGAASRSKPSDCPVATATRVDRQTESTREWNETARAPARRDEGPSARRAMSRRTPRRASARNDAAPERPGFLREPSGRRARRPSWNTVRGVRRDDESQRLETSRT